MPRLAIQPKHRSPRVEHLDAHISREQRKLIERAAELSGVTVAEYVAFNLQNAAMRTIEESELVRLNARESRLFAEALLHPRAANSNLRAAAKRYVHDSR